MRSSGIRRACTSGYLPGNGQRAAKNPTNFIGFLLTLEFSGDIIQEEINPSDLVGIKRAEVFGRLK